MKNLAILALVFACALSAYALLDTDVTVTDEIIAAVNAGESSWTAAHNHLTRKSVKEVKKLLGAKLSEKRAYPAFAPRKAIESEALTAVPASFDARQQWPSCIHPVRDQQKCGSCWAFSASEALSDRLCIATKGATNVVLSPQYLVSCDQSDMGCDGGRLDTAWNFMATSGLPTDACLPYISGGGDSGSCPNPLVCADGSAKKLYKAANPKHISGGIFFWETAAKMQTEIMTNGPIQVAFEVYQDFISYASGVYVHKTGSLLGGHAVEAVGWGVQNGTPYWIIKNSWNTNWGIDGYFLIKRGVNECGIEGDAWAGMAATN